MHNKRGVTLIEALIAMLILATTSAAVIAVMVQVLSLNNFARTKNKANSYVQEGLEQVRGYFQANGFIGLLSNSDATGTRCYKNGNFGSGTSTICLADQCNCNPSIQIEGQFCRYILLLGSSSPITVTSNVCWNDRGVFRVVSATTQYYDY